MRAKRGAARSEERTPDLVVVILPEPTAVEAEVVAAVLALLSIPASHDSAASAARSRWAEAGRHAARRGIEGVTSWGRTKGE